MTTLTQQQLKDTFGAFDYHEDPRRRGWIVQDPTWAAANIEIIVPPFPMRTAAGTSITRIGCHRLVAADLRSILDELLTQRLQHLIVTWDGCYAARHQMTNPKNPLSTHSWAVAVDTNAAAYPAGSHKQQDPRLVSIFARRGWIWGGQFSTPDPMHFEVGPRWLEHHRTGSQGGEAASPAPPSSPQTSDLDALIDVIVNGKPIAPGRLIGGSAYVPARAVAEALGATVAWDSSTRTVRITRP